MSELLLNFKLFSSFSPTLLHERALRKVFMRKTKFGIELPRFFMSKGSSNPKLGFLKPNLIPHISPSEVNNIGTMKRNFGFKKQ